MTKGNTGPCLSFQDLEVFLNLDGDFDRTDSPLGIKIGGSIFTIASVKRDGDYIALIPNRISDTEQDTRLTVAPLPDHD